MTSLEAEHKAQEAKRLLNEPLLAEVLENMRNEALEALADCDATDVAKVQKLQAMAQACVEFIVHLNRLTLPVQAQAGDDGEQTGAS